jgi:hypothetical protein
MRGISWLAENRLVSQVGLCLPLIDTCSKFRLRMRIARQIRVAKVRFEKLTATETSTKCPALWKRQYRLCKLFLTNTFIYVSFALYACYMCSQFLVYWPRCSLKLRQTYNYIDNRLLYVGTVCVCVRVRAFMYACVCARVCVCVPMGSKIFIFSKTSRRALGPTQPLTQ